jgi:hypothetical protein
MSCPADRRSLASLTSLAAAGWLAAAAALAGAQPNAPPAPAAATPAVRLFLVPDGRTVRVLLNEAPPVFGGFVVYRGRAGAAPEKVTPEPVVRVRSPQAAAAMMDPADRELVRRAVRGSDEVAMIRRLERDPFAGGVISALFPAVGRALGRLYVDTGLTPGAVYDYRLVFTDGEGKETDARLTGRVRLADVAPRAPTALRAESGDHRALLRWQYPKFAGEPGDHVIGFHVLRAAAAGGPWTRLTPTPVLRDDGAPLAWADESVREGETYHYRLHAVDLAGRLSAPAAAAVRVVDRTPPAAPADVAARGDGGAVVVSWRLSPELDVAGYHVERAAGLGKPFTRLTRALVPGGRPQFVDSAAPPRRQHFYRVVAADSAGNESQPSNAGGLVLEDRAAPAPPANVRVTLGTGRRPRLTWARSPSRDVRGYFIYRGDDSTRLVRLVRDPVAATAFTDSGFGGAGLRPGGRYAIRVSAVDSSFNESARTA